MAKRGATTDLNHDNWDDEEEDDEQEAGEFKKANPDVLNQRQIKIARRRKAPGAEVTASSPTSSESSAFKGFSFGLASTGGTTANKPFSLPQCSFGSSSGAAPPLVFGAVTTSATGFGSTKTPGTFGFGQVSASSTSAFASTTTAAPFSFGSGTTAASSGFGTATATFSFGSNAAAASTSFGLPAKSETSDFGTLPTTSKFSFGSTTTSATIGSGSTTNPPKFSFGSAAISATTSFGSTANAATFGIGSAATSTASGLGMVKTPATFAFGSAGASSASDVKVTTTTALFGSNTGFRGLTDVSHKALATNVTNTQTAVNNSPTSKGNGDSKSTETTAYSLFQTQLKTLNKSVLDWISTHVQEDPYCILSPIFKDYDKHLDDIEQELLANSKPLGTTPSTKSEDVSETNGSASSPPSVQLSASSKPTSVSSGFAAVGKFGWTGTTPTFGAIPTSTTGTAATLSVPTLPSLSASISSIVPSSVPSTTSGLFKFGSGGDVTASFGSANTKTTASSGFFPSLSSPPTTATSIPVTNPPSLFSAGFFSAKPAAGASTSTFGQPSFVLTGGSGSNTKGDGESEPQGSQEGGDEGEYEPPKREVVEIKEEGAFYTVRCKLFYNKAGSWVDRGVGNLSLKKTDDGKVQLLMRTDTALGNILLNILLPKNMFLTKKSEKDVSIVCVLNPPISKEPAGPVPVLFKVKTADDAAELFKQLEENNPK